MKGSAVELGTWIAGTAGAAALALCLCGLDPCRMPQVVSGGDALSVAFGDAKAVLSAFMVQKADSYFHGGVDMEGHEHVEGREHRESRPDPWRWINARIRAPEVERHLEGGRTVEILPWLWASVRADPHNVDAWTTAWHTANNMMKDKSLGAEILAEGIRRNPNSVELLFYLGRHVYDRGRGDAAEAERTFARAREVGLDICGGELARLKGKDAEALALALDYLSAFAEKRGDAGLVRRCLAEAEQLDAVPAVLNAIRRRL